MNTPGFNAYNQNDDIGFFDLGARNARIQDNLVMRGAAAQARGDKLAEIGYGIVYVADSMTPNSMTETAFYAVGGKLLSEGVGLASKALVSRFPVLGKSIGFGGEVANGGIARFNDLLSGVTRADARSALRSGELGLSEAQTKTILNELRNGRVDTVGLKLVNEDGTARLVLERAGRESGFQRFSYEIKPDGSKSLVVQTAFDDAGNLMRQKPGAAKNNLYDVKKGR